MIGQLNGKLIEKNPTSLVIDCGGVGYEVKISLNTYSALGAEEAVKIYTKFIVREDAQLLYGFAEPVEREMFNHLISVSGIGPKLAENIVNYRDENGAFSSRDDIKKVARLGDKAFEQGAGFLRIKNAKNPLDDSAVHPESYALITKMAKDVKLNVADLIGNKETLQQIKLENYCSESIGLPTLKDIVKELEKPGLDPRQTAKVFTFNQNIRTINDLHEGQLLPGIVNNITNFGCFVDIGIKESGLVHVSNLSDKFVSDVTEIVSLHQQVIVKVLEVDIARKRIQLSMNYKN